MARRAYSGCKGMRGERLEELGKQMREGFREMEERLDRMPS